MLTASGAWAQSAKIFVSANGSDGNVGTPASPKRTFQAAHDAVAAGGEIVVLDTAGYGGLTITKSLSLTVPSGINAFVTTSGFDGVDVAAGPSDTVTLRGLIIEGNGSGGQAHGITCTSVGTLRVEDCTVRQYSIGIDFGASATAHLIVSNSKVHDVTDGIVLSQGTSFQALYATVSGCIIDGASFAALYAVAIDGVSAQITATNCVLSNSNYGIYAGTAGQIFADSCLINQDVTGVATRDNSGETVSFGNNKFSSNGSNGSFVLTVSPQ